MASQAEESDQLIQRVRHGEAQTSLLSPVSESREPHFLMNHLSCLPCNICVKSKAAVLLLFWSVVIGIVYLSRNTQRTFFFNTKLFDLTVLTSQCGAHPN